MIPKTNMRRKRLLHKQYSSRLQAFVTHLGVLIKTRLVVVLLGGVFLAFGLCSMPSPFKDDWATRDGTGTVSEPSFKPGYHLQSKSIDNLSIKRCNIFLDNCQLDMLKHWNEMTHEIYYKSKKGTSGQTIHFTISFCTHLVPIIKSVPIFQQTL